MAAVPKLTVHLIPGEQQRGVYSCETREQAFRMTSLRSRIMHA